MNLRVCSANILVSFRNTKNDIFQNSGVYHLGDTVDNTCAITGDPTLTVTWTKVSNDVCSRTVPNKSLNMSSLQPSALGTWKCTAKRQYGSLTKQITISANGKCTASPPSADSRWAVVNFWRKNVHNSG